MIFAIVGLVCFVAGCVADRLASAKAKALIADALTRAKAESSAIEAELKSVGLHVERDATGAFSHIGPVVK